MIQTCFFWLQRTSLPQLRDEHWVISMVLLLEAGVDFNDQA